MKKGEKANGLFMDAKAMASHSLIPGKSLA
jgi:hypothetical protein